MPKSIWIAFLLIISGSTIGLAQEIKFKALRNEVFDGSVNCLRIMEDSQGFMWFGTYQGAYKYDGVRMESFTHNPSDSNSITHNFIIDMLQDGPDIYLTALGNGNAVNKISTLDHSVSRLYIPQNKNNGHGNIIKLNNGYLLCGGVSGLIYFNAQTMASTFIPNVMVDPIIQTEDGEILVSDEDTLLRYRIENNALVFTSGTTVRGPITSTAEVLGSRIFGTSKGMFSFDNHIVFPPQIANGNIRTLLVDSEGNLWIGTANDGLYRWHLSDTLIEHFSADEREGYLHSNTINSLYEDRNHLVWIGTNAGPFFTDIYPSGITTITLPAHSIQKNALPIYQPDPDRLWVGDTRGIHIYDLNHQEYKSDHLPTGNIATIFGNPAKDSIWLSTYDRGAFLLARKRSSDEFSIILHYQESTNTNKTLVSNQILSILVDNAYNVWFGHYSAGIDILKKDGSWFHLPDSLVNGVAISSFLQSRDKTIWIGKLDSGLSSCQRQQDGHYTFKHYTPENSGIQSSVVTCLAEDKNHQIWVGTMSGGLYKLDPATEATTSYTILEGLKSNNILNVVCDSKNNIWCSTSQGIAYLASGSKKFRVYTAADGLPQNTFQFYSSCLLKDGRLAFGTQRGIALINPDNLFKEPSLFRPFVSRILLQNKPLVPHPDSLIQVNAYLVKELTLTYKQDLLTFEFSNGYYKDPDRVLFMYFLEGYHRDWVDIRKSNIATFSRLPTGKYTLYIKSSIDEGNTYTSIGEPIRITILPPWWQTWWFRSAAFLASMLLIYFVIRQRTLRLLALQRIDIERKLALEAERSRISRDMHDDLGSGLSAIHLMSNYLKENTAEKYPQFSEDIEKIQKSSEDLNQRIREIIWTVNSKDDTLQSMMLFIQRHAHEMSDTTKIPIHVHRPIDVPDVSLNGVQRKHLFLAVKEAINNAVKHGDPTSIDIELLHADEHAITLRVKDNGKGFDPGALKAHQGGNGLGNMKDRMVEIGGATEIKSSAEGTEIIFTLKV